MARIGDGRKAQCLCRCLGYTLGMRKNHLFSLLIAFLFVLLAFHLSFAKAFPTARVELSLIDEPPDIPFPVSSAIPFPKGILKSLDHLKLTNSNGVEVSAQFSYIATWPDKSYKSVLVDFLALPKITSYTLHYGEKIVRQRYNTKLSATQTDRHLLITNGPLRFEVSKNAFTVFDQVYLDINANDVFEENEKLLKGPGDIVARGNYRSGTAVQTYRSSLFDLSLIHI